MNASERQLKLAQSIVTSESVVFWFRRDLRLEDNAGLYHALKSGKPVVPLFIFDTCILDKLEDRTDKRVVFIYQSLMHMKQELESMGSSLLILYGDPVKLFPQLHPAAVYTNHDFEPYAKERDDAVKQNLSSRQITFHTFKDHVIFEKDEVLKDAGGPYTVFTPYSRKWKAKLNAFYIKPYPNKKYHDAYFRSKPLSVPSLGEMNFSDADTAFPERVIKTSIISRYHETRDLPAMPGTSRLSVHLRFGTVSIRKLAAVGLSKNEKWLNELIWRDFYQMILWHFPHVVNRAFKADYDNIQWRNNPEEFQRWCTGTTGYPIVDAGMRELNATGFMHNRVRMVVASFLCKHLLIDWRWGEAYFAAKLLDFDLASNNGGWQWAAGSGCDAAPYFRVFNPQLQTEKFDPELKYIRKWVPELNSNSYPKPMVDHAFARKRALETYADALKNQ